MDKLRSFVQRRFELILFALLSLVVLMWFGGWNYIHQIDSLFYLNPERRLEEVMFFWKAGETLGLSLSEFNLVPFYLFQTVLMEATEPLLGQWEGLVASQAIIYYLTIFLAFVFSNLFLRQFYHQVLGFDEIRSRDRMILLIVTLFYVINPYTISTVYWRYMTWALFWAALPLLGYLFLKYLDTRRIRYIVLSAAVFITPLGAGFPQVGFINLIIVYLGLFVLVHLRGHSLARGRLPHLAVFVILFLALIAWVALPLFLSLSSTSTYTSAPDVYSDYDYLEHSSQFTTMRNVLTLAGNYLLYNNVDSFPYSWSDAYLGNGVIMAALFIFPVLAAIAIWSLGAEKNPGRRKVVLLIAAAYVVMPLLMKGIASPAIDLGSFLFDLHSTFFRHPYDRFIGVFVLLNAFLMLYALRGIALRLPDRRRFLGACLVLVLLIAMLGYPFFTGQIINQVDKVNLSETQYMDLEEALGTELDGGRVLVVPFSISGEYSYNISGDINRPNSKSLAYDFLPQGSILQFTLSPYDRFALGYIYEVIKNNDSEAFFSFMHHLNVKAFLVQKDYSLRYNMNPYTAIPAQDSLEFIRGLTDWEGLSAVYEDQNVALYQMPSLGPSNLVGGEPALLLGAYSEVPTVSIQKTLVPLTGLWGYDPGLFDGYSDLLVSDSPDTMAYLINLMSEKLSISPYELGRSSSEGWEKYPTMDAIYSNSSLILESGASYTDGEVKGEWTFEEPSDLNGWAAPPGATAMVSLSDDVRPGTSGVMMTMTNSTSGTSYLDGPEVNVTSNNILWSINWVRTENAAGSNISLMGYDSVEGSWKYLNYSLPGTSGTTDWKEYSFKVIVPENIEKVKLRLIASSSLDPDRGDARTWFDLLSLHSMFNQTTSPFMQIPIEVPETGRYHLLSEMLVSPEGGMINLELAGGNTTIGTSYPQQKWIWNDQTLYLNKGTYTAMVRSVEGTNSVRTMSLMNETNYLDARELVYATVGDKSLFISHSASSFYKENASLQGSISESKSLLFSENGTAWTTLSIPSDGDYRLSLQGTGDLSLTIDGVQHQLVSDAMGMSVAPAVRLVPGSYNVTINGSAGASITSLWTYKSVDDEALADFLEVDGAIDVKVDRLAPTHLRAEVSTNSPFMFILPESFDDRWKVSIYEDGKLVRTASPVAAYGCLNGFWIEETGDNLTLDIYYGPQSLLDLGLMVSLAALLFVAAVVIIEWRYGQGTIWRKVHGGWSRIRRKGP